MVAPTQRLFENNVHISELVTLTADAPPATPVIAGEIQPRVFTINKQTRHVHFVFEADTAYNDPIVGGDVDIYVYYTPESNPAFYQNLTVDCGEGRIAIPVEDFMGVKFVYLVQNLGTVVKAQVVFE